MLPHNRISVNILSFAVKSTRCNNLISGKQHSLTYALVAALQNTPFLKLCTSFDYDAIAGNSLKNPFPGYAAVMSCCVGCQDC
jgi:hypothetical protein